MKKVTAVKKRRPCKTGKVYFEVSICVDRNAVVRDSEGETAHKIQGQCFRKTPQPPYKLKITPLDHIETLSKPALKALIRERVNTRALFSFLLALADADFEAALLRVGYI